MIYGYTLKQINKFGLCEMKEITFAAPPDVLREIATFLNTMAAAMESGELPDSSHRHIRDTASGWDSRFPDKDIVVHSPPRTQYTWQINEAAELEKARRQRFVDELREDQKAEFIDGEVIVQPPARYAHVLVSDNLSTLMRTFASVNKLGVVTHEKILVSLTRNDYEPDICFWSTARSQGFTPAQMRFPAPDMAVEVLSPSTQQFDRGVKMEDYAAHGVTEYWIIDADACIVEQYLLQGERYELAAKVKDGTLVSVAMVGLRLPAEAIFDEQAHERAMRAIFG
jgi:Uma2 family endonuclease